jgi:hypothetical protein
MSLLEIKDLHTYFSQLKEVSSKLLNGVSLKSSKW